MVKHAFKVLVVASAALLYGCGDDTYSIFNDDTTTPPTDGASSTPASVTLVADATQLSSGVATAAQGVIVTAIVKDASNNIVSGQTVNFSTTSGAIGPVASDFVTDSSGQTQAFVHTGGDPRNRDITVRASAGGASDTLVVKVIGTTLSISGPATTQFNVPTEYSALLVDGSGSGISNEVVTITTNAGNTITAETTTTDTAGLVTFELTPTVAATRITVAALGETKTKDVAVSTDQFSFTAPVPNEETPPELALGSPTTVSVRWLRSGSPAPNGTVVNFAATRGTLSASSATTSGGVASVSVSSNFSGFSQIEAWSDALSKPRVSQTVEFVASTPNTIEIQATPSTIGTNQTSEIRAIVRDPAQNLVKNQTVVFEVVQDASNGTVDNPSVVTDSLGSAKTTYRATSATTAADGVVISATVAGTSVTDSTTLTVGSRSAHIVVGTGSKIISKDESTYQLPFTVVVTDQAGNATPDAEVTLSVLPHQYRKGTFGTVTATCDNEDVDYDTINDPGEDLDADGILDPGNVAAAPATLDLDEDGSGQFLVTYPKDVGLFAVVDVIARVVVEGTETTSVRRILLTVSEEDFENLPGISPWGVVGDCGDPD